jgi:hypothetical protein
MSAIKYTERARALVNRWLDGHAGDVQVDEEGSELRDVLVEEWEARADLERRIADALRRAVSQ